MTSYASRLGQITLPGQDTLGPKKLSFFFKGARAEVLKP